MTPESSAPTQPGSSAREPETQAAEMLLKRTLAIADAAARRAADREETVALIRSAEWSELPKVEDEAREQSRREGLAEPTEALRDVLERIDKFYGMEIGWFYDPVYVRAALLVDAMYPPPAAPRGRDTGEAGE